MSELENKKEKQEIQYTEVQFTNIDVSDDDFSSMKEESDKILEEQESKVNNVPVFFPASGKYLIRVYPDRDSNGKLRYFKRVFTHKLKGISDQGKEINNIKCYFTKGIEDKLDAAERSGALTKSEARQHKAKEQYYVLVRLIDCPVSEWHSAGKEYIMVLNKFQSSKFIEFFSSLSNDQIKNCLNIKEPYYPIEINFEQQENSSFPPGISSIKFSGEKIKFDSMILPSGVEWKGLDNVYINESTTLSDKLRGFFDKWLASKNFKTGLVDPSFEDSIPYDKFQNNKTKTIVKPQTVEETCEIISNKNNVGALKDVKFGNPPKEQHVDCVLCPNEVSCYGSKQ